ncbi:MAG: proton-conducting transporter membrane subunit [Thermoleophilia bacterium]
MIARLAMICAPGLLVAATWAATAGGLEMPWLLLGTHLRADDTAQVFLVLAAVVWTLAALAAGPTLREPQVPRRRLIAFAAVALLGNVGLAVAQDVVSFFTFFSMMSLAAYGLVAARSGAVARRAGRIYIGMAMLAEGALLAGFTMAVRSAGDLELEAVRAALAEAGEADLVIALLLIGLGVKAGVLGLHMWMPLAYTAAPLPAAAVLAGALTELGLLGWLRVLPIGEAALDGWGAVLVAVGFAAVAYGLVVGATQSFPAAVLAYSSIGQIGLMVAGIGVALADPGLAPAAVAGVLVLALLHGVVKGVMFIGLGVVAGATRRAARAAALAGLLVAGLVLAGAPLTGGAVAKDALKSPGAEWWPGMETALAASAVATTILIGRMLFLIADPARPQESLPGRAPAWALGGGLAAALAFPALVATWPPLAEAYGPAAPTLPGVWAALWPVAAGAIAALALRRLTAARPGERPRIPTGDVVVAAEHVGDRVQSAAWRADRAFERAVAALAQAVRRADPTPLARRAARVEARTASLGAGALALAGLVVVLAVALSGAWAGS